MRAGFFALFASLVADEAARKAAAPLDGIVTALNLAPAGGLRIDLLLPPPEDAAALCAAEEALERAGGIPEARIALRPPEPLSGRAACEAACRLKDWALRRLRAKDAFLASLASAAAWTPGDDAVSLAIAAACHDPLQGSDLAGWLERFFRDGLDCTVRFRVAAADGDDGDLARYAEAMCQSANDQLLEDHRRSAPERERRMKEIEAAAAADPGNGYGHGGSRTPGDGEGPARPAARDRKDRPLYKRRPQAQGVFWGKADQALQRTPIAELNAESGLVRVEGQVRSMEHRLVSNDTRVLLKFSLTDFTSSIGVTAFLRPEDADLHLERFAAGSWVGVAGTVSYDARFARDLTLQAEGFLPASPPPDRTDDAPEKRVELHVHTKMSAMDAVCDTEALVEVAAAFGHDAVAITDHGVVQAFPDAYGAYERLAAAKQPIKLIYGVEAYLVDDGGVAVYGPEAADLSDGFVAADVETTGLDPSADRLLEVGAVHFRPDGNGGFVPGDRLSLLVDPGIPIPEESTRLTGITPEMVRGASTPDEAVERLAAFLGGRPMVAHNAFFDLDFLRHAAARAPGGQRLNPPVVDTLSLAQALLPGLANHKLGTVAAFLGASPDRAHRAADDAEASGRILCALMERTGAKTLADLDATMGRVPRERLVSKDVSVYHIILLAKDALGLYDLYRLVSESHTRYFHYRPRIPRSLLRYFRTGLVVGAACEAGEVFRAVRAAYEAAGRDYGAALAAVRGRETLKKAWAYDYLEVQPATNNAFLLREAGAVLKDDEDLRNLNRLVVALGEAARRPVCATSDAHYLTPRDAELRRILLTAKDYADADLQPPLHFRTTEEMLEEFAYLGGEKAVEVVVRNPRRIAERIEPGLRPFPKGSYPPDIEGADEEIQRIARETALSLYGRDGNLPEPVRVRMERELGAIVKHHFSVMYYIAHKLVKKSNDDGYLVCSRGSVGSSFAATLLGVSEVNPLPPHYICRTCRRSEFDETGRFGSGYDLPPKDCPECGTPYAREGQDIPFETFLGFDGDKQPDIDLNFSGEYQSRAHRYIVEMFGSAYTFRAGTISGYADKNAISLVLGYYEKNGRIATNAEKSRLAEGLVGVKRTTGQHPGGIVVLPKDREIYDFTPVQRPADRVDSDTVTTHFDFNALHDTMFKLDILGHDDPTMLKMLGDLTGVDPVTVPIPDADVMSLFASPRALGLPPDWNVAPVGTLGMPELGTHLAREIIRETKPSRFFDLVQLMGLSHGTNVWKGNAQDLIRSGTATIEEVIGCRDSIMTWLIHQGLPSKAAFDIMEKVRKGKGVSDAFEALMRENGVPDWYIDSCRKIRYMFPKAHAAAYAISSLRIGWYKVHRPLAYYAAYFSVRGDAFDAGRMCRAAKDVRADREVLRQRQTMRDPTLTDRDEKVFYILELVEEMLARGFRFLPVDLYRSDAQRFTIEDGALRPPLRAMPGVGETVAHGIAAAREAGPFKSRDDLSRRAGVGSAVITALDGAGCLKELPQSSQMDLFGFLQGAS